VPAVDDLPAHAGSGQRGAQQGVHGLAHLRAVALQAIGHPGQVQSGDQRGVVVPLVGQGKAVEGFVAEQQMAVQRGHQRCGVRDHHVCIELPEHPKRLFPCDPDLLIGPRRAPLAVAPLAQHFRHHRHAQPVLLQPKAQRLGQLCLAGAFGAEQGDASRAGHGGMFMAALRQSLRCHARQPTTLSAVNSA
jgi:hypothetical protein